jgi:hypothetical protein
MKFYKIENGQLQVGSGKTLPEGFQEFTTTFDDNGVEIFPDELQVILDAEQSERDATEYQRLRQAEYPPIEDYIDGIVKGDDTQVQEYIDKCLAVKAKYPKE